MTVKSNTYCLEIASAILVIAFVLRIVWGTLVPVVPVSDSEAYDILARTLYEHGVYGWNATSPSAYWPPGTSALYAILYSVFGKSFAPIIALNIALSTGIVGLTIWLGWSLFDGRTGLFAGFLMAIWPSEVFYVTILASELPFTFFTLLGVAAWLNLRLSNLARVVVCGLSFAAATYFRPIAILLPIVLWLSVLPEWQRLRKELPIMLLTMVIIGAAITPWSLRNEKVFGHFVLMSTSDGVNLWIGNNANSDGFYMPLPESVQGLGEYDQNKKLQQEAIRYIFENPAGFVLRSIKKTVLLHINETLAVTWNAEGITRRFGDSSLFPLKFISRGFWTGVLLFALGGILILARKRGILQALMNPAVLIWVYFTTVYSIFLVADRFHFPSHPFVSMLAVIAILASVRSIKRLPVKVSA
jgi:4-amino-4-deoxy-L-arabinose transferase-like glycosyltransferase